MKYKVVHIGVCLLGYLWTPLFSLAQENLIPNWSFEELRFPNSEFPCPTGGAGLSLTEYWRSASGSADYYHACSNPDWPDYAVPQNWGGWQEPYHGQAYAAIACFAEFFDDAREYLWIELSDTLVQDQGYYFEMQVSQHDSENYAVGGLGAYFSSVDTRFWDGEDFFEVTPQVENPIDNLLDDKIRWMKVSGQFFAQGGEKFMTIGSFRRDTEENIQQISYNPTVNINWGVAAYYVDAVVLIEDNSIGIAERNEVEVSLYPNPATDVLSLASKENFSQVWLTDLTGKWLCDFHQSGGSWRMDVSGIANGVYLLRATDEYGNLLSRRVIKQ